MSECTGYGVLISQLMEGVGNGLFSLSVFALTLWFMDRHYNSKSKEV